MAKITLATVKRFIKANQAALHIQTRSRFDGMTDGVESCSDQSFRPVGAPQRAGKPFVNAGRDNTLGVAGAWFVFDSRDFFREFDDGKFVGIRVSNCCGDFVLAIPKKVAQYEVRVRALEAQGLTRSDAQGVVDAEDLILAAA